MDENNLTIIITTTTTTTTTTTATTAATAAATIVLLQNEQQINPGLSLFRQILITLSFVIGATGNTSALWILYKSAKTRNRKHVFLLRCLASNDLIAQVGMLLVINLHKYQIIPLHWTCVSYVLLRAFGIGSGCVAFVMALERWLALTRPFLYQQLVTYRILKRFAFCLWFGGAFLTYLPLIGFGLYYKGRCLRYRDAVYLWDRIYAYLFLVFGTGLCLCIAYCNLTVMWELSRIRTQSKVLIRRVSRSTINNRVIDYASRHHTPEEVAFAKLMAIICIIFLACWVPQMISIPMAQFCSQTKFCGIFSKTADVLMCVYFTLDPYVYVLQRYKEHGKHILPCFCCCPSSQHNFNNNKQVSLNRSTPTTVLLNPSM